jgi:hypothetical protein
MIRKLSRPVREEGVGKRANSTSPTSYLSADDIVGTRRVGTGSVLAHHGGDASATAAGLTGLWVAALDARWSLSPGSPVAALDRLLRERRRRSADEL